jgi:thioredoxin 1
MMANLTEVTDASFQTDVLESAVPVLVDFGATWCGPCKAIAPIVEEVAQEFDGRAKVVAMDVDSNRDTASTYGIMNIPALVFFSGGEIQERLLGGNVSKDKITETLNGLLG